MGLHPAIAAVRQGVRRALADLDPGATALVACSGGADSLSLLAATVFEGHKSGLRVVGTTVDWPEVRSRTVASGEFFTAEDDADGAAVAVLGATTATELFGTTRVVGQQVTIAGTPFTIVGVLAEAGSSADSDLDDVVVALRACCAVVLHKDNVDVQRSVMAIPASIT